MTYSPAELAAALGLPPPTDEQAAVIAAPPGPLVVVAGAGAGKTETMAARVVWLVANGYAEPGPGARADLHPQGRRAAAAPGAVAAGPAGRPPRRRRRQRAPRRSAPITRSPARCCASTACCCRSSPTPGCSARPRCGSWPTTWCAPTPARWTPTRTPAAVTAMVLRAGRRAGRAPGRHRPAARHPRRTRAAGAHPARRAAPARPRPQPAAARHAGHPDRTRRAGAADRRRCTPGCAAEKVMDFGSQMSAAARLAADLPAGRRAAAAAATGWCCSTSTRTPGTPSASRCRRCSAAAPTSGLALTAVGDPIQSIYGWRGASATNLPRFTTDFPQAGRVARRRPWNCAPAGATRRSTLHIANAVSAEARRRSVAVRPLRSRPGAATGHGAVRAAGRRRGRTGLGRRPHRRPLRRGDRAGCPPPTAAVLVRRNADAGPIAEALTARGIPVEVVGLAGLLSIPEGRRRGGDAAAGRRPDRRRGGHAGAHRAALAARRRATSPRCGAARWPSTAQRPAAVDRRADHRRGGSRRRHRVPGRRAGRPGSGRRPTPPRATAASPRWPPNWPGCARYLAQPGQRPGRRGAAGARAWTSRCARRGRSPRAGPAPNIWTAFADVVAGYADGPAATVAGLLAYLDAAAAVGERPGPRRGQRGRPDRVQILTVHAAKGLEWQVVAVPHLSARVFPSTASKRTWLTDPADLPPLLRGDRAAGGLHGVPVLDTSTVNDRKALVRQHRRPPRPARAAPHRRGTPAALRRDHPRRGHPAAVRPPLGRHRVQTARPLGLPLRDQGHHRQRRRGGRPCGEVEHWAPAPADGEPNPLRDNVRRSALAGRPAGRPAAPTSSAAPRWSPPAMRPAQRRRRGDGPRRAGQPTSTRCWPNGPRRRSPPPVTCPVSCRSARWSNSTATPRRRARRLTRRLPHAPTRTRSWAPPSTTGCSGSTAPSGCSTSTTCPARWTTHGRRRRASSPHCRRRSPRRRGRHAPRSTSRCRSRWRSATPSCAAASTRCSPTRTAGSTVVDWKTGEPPADEDARRHAAVQLAVYRLAWAALSGLPESIGARGVPLRALGSHRRCRRHLPGARPNWSALLAGR